jgi:ABC-type Fe3+ transport system permease subunit
VDTIVPRRRGDGCRARGDLVATRLADDAHRPAGPTIWVVLTALPLAIPTYVGSFAMIGALGPRGILQGWLEPLGVERLPSIYGFGGRSWC